MKKKVVFKTAFTIVAVLLLAAVTLHVTGVWEYAYAEGYAAGDAEILDTVKNLKIDWTSGRVRILYHEGQGIRLHETANQEIPEDRKMRWRLEGDTLEVAYEKPGFHLFSLASLQKELTVELPQEIALEEVRVDVTSGDIEIPALRADDLRLDMTSGNVRAAAAANTVTVEATSGDVALALPEKVGQLSIETTSGNILLNAAEANKVMLGSTSGDMKIRLTALNSLKISATSGDIALFLPEAPGFSARMKTTSGSLRYDLPLVKQGNEYTCGDGSGSVEVSTTSGDISVHAAGQGFEK